MSHKIALLLQCRVATARVAKRWTALSAQAKGISGTPLAGEEAIAGPWGVLFALNRYVDTLIEIERFGAPRLDAKSARRRASGQVVVDVFPSRPSDRILFNGVRAEVWMDRGVTLATLHDTMAVWYRQTHRESRLALVLGAGNISSIPVLDVLYKLVAEGTACMLKVHPLTDCLGPVFEEALAPLVAGGYLRLTYGGAEVGRYLCSHELIDEIHVTGSVATRDAIAADNASGKRITSELGNVSPTIVVPGPWSEADLRFQADHIATTKLYNNGFNCISSQVLIVPTDWPQRDALVAAVERAMARVPDRPAYYPGAHARCRSIAGSRAARRYGRSDADFLPRTLVDVDPADLDDAVFANEAFCPLLAVASLPGNLETYLDRAVDFANRALWGTLAANLIVHPRSMRDRSDAVDAAIAGLRFGCVGVNAWSGVGFLLAPVPWGAYRSETSEGSESGDGVVHNSHLFERTQKAVVHAPFRPFPRSILAGDATLLPQPPWFISHRNQAKIGEELCKFEAAPTARSLAKIAMLTLTG
ncbi:MAG: aldehyde dehydrogenase family protein [Candidatus Eremiobacteraeota bacterium]|nr:aldehyde dehydrogenase family protein [Candidatus Eremiobacteraeota bacterium]